MEYNVKYLIGYPGWNVPMSVTLVVNRGAIRVRGPLSKENIYFSADKIRDISFDYQKKRSGTRAATGALVGGVLTGGIGLLAGAAIGAKAKDKSQLVILFDDEQGVERTLVFETKKQTNAIFNAITDAINDAKEGKYIDGEKQQHGLTNSQFKLLETQSEKNSRQLKEGDNSAVLGCVVLIVLAAIIALIINAF